MRLVLVGVTVVLASSCGGADLLGVEAPKQRGQGNSMQERGAKGFEQRQRDCVEMPNAQACYDVGLNYEMGLAVTPDRDIALDYYDKACAIDANPEHCEAAARLRKDKP